MIRTDESLTLDPALGYRKHTTLELREFLNMIDMLGYGPNVTVHVTEGGALRVSKEAIHNKETSDGADTTE